MFKGSKPKYNNNNVPIGIGIINVSNEKHYAYLQSKSRFCNQYKLKMKIHMCKLLCNCTTRTFKIYTFVKVICLFLFWLKLYVPVNKFSVMSGRSHSFLGITSTFWEVNVSCSRIQHGDLSKGRTNLYLVRPRC